MLGVQGHRVDGDSRIRHGASRRAQSGGYRQRALHRLGVRHGARSHRHAALRSAGHSHSLRFRRALPRAGGRMNASVAWLNAFLDSTRSATELRDLLTAHTATVEELIPLRADLAPIVVARVVEERAHPDSEHLHLTKVDMGTGELLDVVCGAPNVAAGKLYPFAPTGTVMPGGLKIEKRKIRGHTSNGMLCSARELGLGQEHEGILELSLNVPPGTP